MPKAEVDISSHTLEQINALLRLFGLPDAASFAKCYGGFSGSNYRVAFASDAAPPQPPVLLKACNDCPASECVAMLDALLWLQRHGLRTCYPRALAAAGGAAGGAAAAGGAGCVCTALGESSPVMVLEFLDGCVAADKAITERGVAGAAVLRAVGEGLVELHLVPLPTAEADGLVLRDGLEPSTMGMCEVGMWKANLEQMRAMGTAWCDEHSMVAFYESRLPELRECIDPEKNLPQGVLHGDPFLDNVLMEADEPSTLRALIDWEDVSSGPLLFDLAVAVIGCCFRDSDNELDLGLLTALLTSYAARRPLAPQELPLLLPMARTALLCNCSWRFRFFNISHPEIAEAKHSYVELRQRIERLLEPEFAAVVQATIEKALA